MLFNAQRCPSTGKASFVNNALAGSPRIGLIAYMNSYALYLVQNPGSYRKCTL